MVSSAEDPSSKRERASAQITCLLAIKIIPLPSLAKIDTPHRSKCLHLKSYEGSGSLLIDAINC